MKRIIETTEASGLESLLGKNVLLLCMNYFYTGKLVGVNETFVELESPSIVYDTGPWADKSYANVQRLHVNTFFVCRNTIESFGESKC